MHTRNVTNISNLLAYHIIWNLLSNIIISIIIWLILSFSFYRSLLEMMIKSNPRVYDLINSLKKNLKTLFDILRRILDLIFLTTICLSHNQLWVIIEGSASLTRYWSTLTRRSVVTSQRGWVVTCLLVSFGSKL